MREVIYKGATRPPMKWGVPLMALVALCMPGVVLSVWLGLGAMLVYGRIGLVALAVGLGVTAIGFAWMRWATARDDQRLHQLLKSWHLTRLNRNRALFGYCRSYGAYRALGASDVGRH